MLKLTWIEFFLKAIPEELVYIWGIYVVSGQPINKLKYILFSISTAVFVFSVRMLPINFGVHSLLSTIFVVSVLYFAGIPLLKALLGSVIISMLLVIGEVANMLLLSLFKITFDVNSIDPVIKFILTSPSLIFLILSIFLIRFFLKRKKLFTSGQRHK